VWQPRPDNRLSVPGPPLTASASDYPRPPALVPCERRVRIELGAIVVAQSRAALRILKTSPAPTIYVPPGDIAAGCIHPVAGRSFSEWTGVASYLDVIAPARCPERAAWTYPELTPRYAALRHHVAFYRGRMDARLA
jgi:uncharacterized protein (DUF427 family)